MVVCLYQYISNSCIRIWSEYGNVLCTFKGFSDSGCHLAAYPLPEDVHSLVIYCFCLFILVDSLEKGGDNGQTFKTIESSLGGNRR